MVPNHEKKKRLVRESMFIPIDRWTLILKNGRTKSFSYEIKALMSFIPIRETCLWCPIIKRKEIIMWIYIVLFEKWNLILKNDKNNFTYKAKASMSFIPMKRMNL